MDLMPERYFTNDLFDNFIERPRKRTELKCDVYEKDGIYNIVMDIPGAKKEDIKLEVEKGYLTISFEKEEETEDESKNYIRKERYYGKYERKFYIGDIDNDDVTAEFNEGVLHVKFKENKKEVNRKRIEIK